MPSSLPALLAIDGFAVIVAVLLAVVVAVVFTVGTRPWDRWLARVRYRFEREENAEYGRVAARFGLTVDGTPAPNLAAEFSDFRFLLSGPASFTLRGTCRTPDGVPIDVVAGEFLAPMPNLSARPGSLRSSVVPVAFVILGPRAGRMPSLSILPEAEPGTLVAFLSAAEEAVRPRDIDFESVEFSRRFHVAGDDRRFAYDLIDAAMIEHLLAASPDPVAWIRGDRVLLHRYGLAPAGPEAVASLLGWGLEFAARIPRVVRDGLANGRYGRDSS